LQKEAYKKIYLSKIEEEKKILKQKEDELNERVNKYFKEKSGGKTKPTDVFWGLKEDFYHFAEKKGGMINFFAKKIKVRTDKIDAEWQQKMKEEQERKERESNGDDVRAEDFIQTQDEGDLDDDLDIDDTPQAQRIEVSQEVLDSIFGRDDDDNEDEDFNDDAMKVEL
jgi:uncharacterized damage-inducible protein DinB